MNGSGPTRRTMLRGLGTTMALPWLEAMSTSVAGAASTVAASTGGGPPVRLAFLFVPNGVHAPHWAPTGTGTDWTPSHLLKPLERVREHVSVLSGLAHHNAKALGDGPGDHARSSACFLTGAHPYKTSGANISAGVSVDQIAASHLEGQTRFSSLELGCEGGRQSGQCDSGYSCVYSTNISWRSARTPNVKETNPRLVFERLFSLGPGRETLEARYERMRRRRSILDYVRADGRRLAAQLGRADRLRLDEYFESVRSLERRIELVETMEQDPAQLTTFERPEGIPGDYREHLDVMSELMILAFKLDQTRVASFMWANEGSNRSFPFLDVAEGHHQLSHHKGDQTMIDKIRRIDRFNVGRFARFVDRLASEPEGDGTLLDNCMVVYGSAIGDGNRHNHDDLPVLLAGGGGGTLAPGRHLAFESGTPLCNLYTSLLDRMDVPVDRFGDSTGRLSGL
ncbi:MAG: DUF1552 domain-containing protein [Planctomycetota bacterium]|nr:DUF1552 domain-containing protein [Planctomycetota bacterium]